ncbi:MAG: hypothetical protein EOO07_16220 [Chitinophagaceae bacterium]|nr:MAG: hypothetical protein EOO07_16220 [Chitinophagaceae bacterium]
MNSKAQLKKIHQFFENLPLSDELIIDEENTNPVDQSMLDKCNFGFFMEIELKQNSMSFDLTNMLPPQSYKPKQKSDKKRK